MWSNHCCASTIRSLNKSKISHGELQRKQLVKNVEVDNVAAAE